jgi:cellulose biosynthesis protein BcsQ
MVARVISIANRKGGVGKTTFALSIAEGLAALKNKRVLVVDLDPQVNISTLIVGGWSADHVPWRTGKTILRLLEDRATQPGTKVSFHISQDVIDHVPGKTVSLLSGDPDLMGYERRLLQRTNGALNSVERHLEETIEAILEEEGTHYGAILFDCPPGFSLITDVVLKRSEIVILPTAPTMLGSQGVQAYVKYLEGDLGIDDARSKTFVFLSMVGRTRTSIAFERLIRAEIQKAHPAYQVFDHAYKYCDGFQQATDRREQRMRTVMAVWRQLDRLRGRTLFHRLYGSVWRSVDQAVTELMAILNDGDEHERREARTGDRSTVRYEARP